MPCSLSELSLVFQGEYGVTDDPMKGIFKQIYDASDEDTKRAMIKSFQTSGGTVL